MDAPGTLHHVMVRGIEGTKIFGDDRDHKAFLDRVSQLVASSQTRILAWALMPNHVHLLLFSGLQGISQFMRRLLTGYALYYNRRHQRGGHLFQDRYKSIVCEKDPYLLELVRYIHLNPLRGRMVRSLKELSRYRWSGHGVLIGAHKNDWQEKEYVLKQFHQKKTNAVRAYSRFVAEGQGQGRRPELTGDGLVRRLGGWSRVLTLRGDRERAGQDGRILGGGDFVSGILKEADERLRRQVSVGERNHVINQMIEEMCDQERIDEQELRRGGQRRTVSEVRGRIAYRLSREWGVSMAEIARNLGISTSGIANAIRAVEGRIKSE